MENVIDSSHRRQVRRRVTPGGFLRGNEAADAERVYEQLQAAFAEPSGHFDTASGVSPYRRESVTKPRASVSQLTGQGDLCHLYKFGTPGGANRCINLCPSGRSVC
jgi:hypothetical protein